MGGTANIYGNEIRDDRSIIMGHIRAKHAQLKWSLLFWSNRPGEVPFGVCKATPVKQKRKNWFNGVKISLQYDLPACPGTFTGSYGAGTVQGSMIKG